MWIRTINISIYVNFVSEVVDVVLALLAACVLRLYLLNYLVISCGYVDHG